MKPSFLKQFDFFVGVPDSLLKPLCDGLISEYGMGAMALIGSSKPKNLVHVLINNGAHETVGGMPTVASEIDVPAIARACGYPYTARVADYDSLERELAAAKERDTLSLIEVKCSIGARADLGRPTTTATENKIAFMTYGV